MNRYEVRLIGDDDLPDDYHWALINRPENTLLLVKESKASRELLDAGHAWEVAGKPPTRKPE